MARLTAPSVFVEAYPRRIVQALFQCDECGAWSIGLATQNARAGQFDDPEMFIENTQSFEWLPTMGSSKAFHDVPDHIADPASEAYRCRSISAYRAAILLARAVIEATAKAKGIMTGTLKAKIDALCDQQFIRAHIKEAAHEARHLGNDMAHGDFEDPADADGADEVLVIMDEILAEVFQSPARTERLRTRREARNDQGPSGGA